MPYFFVYSCNAVNIGPYTFVSLIRTPPPLIALHNTRMAHYHYVNYIPNDFSICKFSSAVTFDAFLLSPERTGKLLQDFKSCRRVLHENEIKTVLFLLVLRLDATLTDAADSQSVQHEPISRKLIIYMTLNFRSRFTQIPWFQLQLAIWFVFMM